MKFRLDYFLDAGEMQGGVSLNLMVNTNNFETLLKFLKNYSEIFEEYKF